MTTAVAALTTVTLGNGLGVAAGAVSGSTALAYGAIAVVTTGTMVMVAAPAVLALGFWAALSAPVSGYIIYSSCEMVNLEELDYLSYNSDEGLSNSITHVSSDMYYDIL